MNPYPELHDHLQVTEEDVALFRDENVGLCRVDSARVSRLLLAQLASVRKHRFFNSFSVTDVIQNLEGVGHGSCAKGEEPFKHLPLKSFWKAHFFHARFLMKNLANHSGLDFENSPKFHALYSHVEKGEENAPTVHGLPGRLSHEFTISGYEERAKNKNLTGEWLIFAKYNSLNYYLCIAQHPTSKKDDDEIFAVLKVFCEPEYPFLFANAV
jgi:hypothetical protein